MTDGRYCSKCIDSFPRILSNWKGGYVILFRSFHDTRSNPFFSCFFFARCFPSDYSHSIPGNDQWHKWIINIGLQHKSGLLGEFPRGGDFLHEYAFHWDTLWEGDAYFFGSHVKLNKPTRACGGWRGLWMKRMQLCIILRVYILYGLGRRHSYL